MNTMISDPSHAPDSARETALLRGAAGGSLRHGWRLAAIALVAVRFVQGWIYWGGGSRRFFYAPSKLDPGNHHWMAYKFQSALPGAIFGMQHVIDWLLRHFAFLYTGVIVFSLVELLVGAMLITGTLTRLAALVSMGLSFVLMAMFGWQGATCIDEWTMAACNFAMGATLVLAGGGAWSVDSLLARRKPYLLRRRWFQWLGGTEPLPLSEAGLKKAGALMLVLTVVFVVGTYNYYRGSVYSPFHSGPVSAKAHHWTLDEGRLDADGAVSFGAFVDAGTPEAASYVVAARLKNAAGALVEQWNARRLSALPASAFGNRYDYLKIHAGPYGLVGPIGSRARVTLGPAQPSLALAPGRYTLDLRSVSGRHWSLPLQLR